MLQMLKQVFCACLRKSNLRLGYVLTTTTPEPESRPCQYLYRPDMSTRGSLMMMVLCLLWLEFRSSLSRHISPITWGLVPPPPSHYKDEPNNWTKVRESGVFFPGRKELGSHWNTTSAPAASPAPPPRWRWRDSPGRPAPPPPPRQAGPQGCQYCGGGCGQTTHHDVSLPQSRAEMEEENKPEIFHPVLSSPGEERRSTGVVFSTNQDSDSESKYL